ncbi:unnamed protein product [Choristocarpus tenellus]
MVEKVKTTSADSRYPLFNQASHCWYVFQKRSHQKFNEWVLCVKNADGDEDACKPHRQLAVSLCPNEWVEKWDEERDEGNFSGIH